jgi:hypothetical protein
VSVLSIGVCENMHIKECVVNNITGLQSNVVKNGYIGNYPGYAQAHEEHRQEIALRLRNALVEQIPGNSRALKLFRDEEFQACLDMLDPYNPEFDPNDLLTPFKLGLMAIRSV